MTPPDLGRRAAAYPRLLTLAVFVAGMVTLALEISAARLLGNVFGTSNLVWANIIGLILLYLTVGYFLGGRWADRSPYPATFYGLLAWAAFLAGVIPLVARPVLLAAVGAVARLDAAIMLGSFLSVLILFSVPIILLGCVSPFAIRLAIGDPARAGGVAGRMYAVSTLGSILGTFLPVLWLIPAVGTARTFLIFSLTLLTVALVGLWRSDRRRGLRYLWMPVVLVAWSLLAWNRPIKETRGQIYEDESAYNYIQVVEQEGVRYLLLNEGQGIHSVYDPKTIATGGTWDYFLAAPFWNPSPAPGREVARLGIVGLAGGTIARQYSAVFGPVPIDGWEIDPGITQVGREYFAMTEPNLNVITADGRWGLAHSPERYSVIGIDAYRLPYIPWQLTTREFFLEVRAHLRPDGVVVINVGRTPDDRRLVDGLAGTLEAVFPSVHVVDVPATFNTIVFATVQPTDPANVAANLERLKQVQADPFLIDVLQRTLANLQPTPSSSVVFTDDRAPIEQLTNSVAIRFLLTGDMGLLQ
ncbi:MAG TPA: fused MFS/spermidine synthase [Anaerolineales bacterium]|nr:fused MFS/spermidine synthase [Anaerolineales bacterium]